MPDLHPDARALLDRFAADGVRPYDQLSVLEARAMVAGSTRLQGERTHIADVRDLLVPNPDGRLPVRIYHPAPGSVAPLVVYLHGGGFVTGSVAVADRACRALAAASGCVIASVEYRLAPENPFPVPLLDAVAAVRWLVDHAPGIGADPDVVVVAGDSAGGNLAAATALALRDDAGPPLAGQLLIYPTLAPTRGNPSASLARHGEGYMMTRGSLEWFWDHYLPAATDGENPLAAPLIAPDLTGLPPALVVVAEFDPLRDEGLAYAERLRAAGVPVTVHEVDGAIHGFWWLGGVLAQAAELTTYLGTWLGELG